MTYRSRQYVLDLTDTFGGFGKNPGKVKQNKEVMQMLESVLGPRSFLDTNLLVSGTHNTNVGHVPQGEPSNQAS